ncbi:hypothetical protein EVAR_69082_1 [Eumeta japonica]|uniref:Uncharacterized protein n=1 Tax=Eumeta variegata TaxID=151549 RepID=A0A4C1ZGM3_EUMVA|nr:hypothetical protein EVAR_69082_1 [Eumeta japonica]
MSIPHTLAPVRSGDGLATGRTTSKASPNAAGRRGGTAADGRHLKDDAAGCHREPSRVGSVSPTGRERCGGRVE